MVPVLDEAAGLGAALAPLAALRRHGHEVLVVDGGSRDASPRIARQHADRVLHAARGRAVQMNAGACAARGAALLFLHADTRLPEGADRRVLEALARHGWGRFDVSLSGVHPALRVIEAAINLRSRLTGIATGDQAIFCRRTLFERVGGFPPIALMEDVALSAALRRHGRPACLDERVVTSSRRWERDGIARTVALMWGLRLAYRLGAEPSALARRYDRRR